MNGESDCGLERDRQDDGDALGARGKDALDAEYEVGNQAVGNSGSDGDGSGSDGDGSGGDTDTGGEAVGEQSANDDPEGSGLDVFVEVVLDGPPLPVDYEFDRQDQAAKVVESVMGPMGRMVGASKSEYRRRYPSHQVAFSANLFTRSHGKLWFGDLDLNLDSAKLQDVADRLGTELFVLSESDGRFSRASDPAWDNALVVFAPRKERHGQA